MTHKFRLAAVHLAFVAMVLRALLPAGWMPDATGTAGAFFVVCTMDSGPVHQTDLHQPGKPAPDGGQHSHEECPFSAAPHVAAPVTVAQLALPAYFAIFSNPPSVAASAGPSALYQPQSPRAPPLFA